MEIIHHHFKEISSTNDWAKKQLYRFDRSKLTLISTDHQTYGRGQYSRAWIAPKNQSLVMSLCFFINEEQPTPVSLTHVLAISTAKVLKAYGIHCQIKWPNDIMINGKKLAGILCETQYLDHQFGVVIGMGLNVNNDQKTLNEVGQPTTSLIIETNKEYAISEIQQKIATLFAQDLQLFLKEGFTPFVPLFQTLILPRHQPML